MIWPTSAKSSRCRPRVASAGVPMRRPEASIGGRGSKGTALRLTVIPISCSRSSACLPLSSGCRPRRSTSARCTSVPPVSTSMPWPDCSPSAADRVHERLGDRLRARHRAALALGEQLRFGDLQRDRLGGDHVLERPALLAGEDGGVDLFGELLLAEDDPRARAAERLVGRRRDDVGAELERVGVQPGGDEAGEVRHVDHQQRPDLVGDLAEAREVELARVGRPAGEQQLRPALARDAGDLVHVDQAASRGRPRRRRSRTAGRRR